MQFSDEDADEPPRASTVTWPKLRALVEVAKTEQYNWCQFMIDQLTEASRNVTPASDISFKVALKKIRFAQLISYIAEHSHTHLDKRKVMDVKNTQLFKKQVDKTGREPKDPLLLEEEKV